MICCRRVVETRPRTSNVFTTAFVHPSPEIHINDVSNVLQSPPSHRRHLSSMALITNEYCSGLSVLHGMPARPPRHGHLYSRKGNSQPWGPQPFGPTTPDSPQLGSVNRRLVLGGVRAFGQQSPQGRAQIQHVRGITEGIKTASTDETVNILMAPTLSSCPCGRLIPTTP